MRSPMFKVYRDREYLASCKHAEDAGAIVALYDTPAMTIRFDHGLTVWREGTDGHAGESFDELAALVWRRVDAMRRIRVDELRRPTQKDMNDIH